MPTVIALQRANHGAHFRAFGLRRAAALIDPFLGVDHAWMSAPTFPPHPHAGFSALSYVFLDSETGIANRDSAGSNNLIEPGGVHWAVAGRGVVHEEVPAEPGKTVHSLQIFVNLPPQSRNEAPFALSVAPQDVPVALQAGIKLRVVAGQFGELRGELRAPVSPPTDVDIFDLTLDDQASINLPIAAGRCAFFLPIFGSVLIDGQGFGLDELQVPVYPAGESPRDITLHADRGASKVVVFSGVPLQSLQSH